MDITVSIPDAIFAPAERLAARLGITRSALYAKAVEAFVEAHRKSEITERLNAIYHEEPGGIDPEIISLQARSLPRDDW